MAKKFCCFWSLKTGAITIGFIDLIISITGLVLILIYMPPKETNLKYLDELPDIPVVRIFPQLAYMPLNDLETLRLTLILVSCFICLEFLIFPLILIIGAIKECETAILAWIFYKLLQFFQVLIVLIFSAVTDTLLFAIPEVNNVFFKIIFVGGWVLWQTKYLEIVINYFKEMPDKQPDEETLLNHMEDPAMESISPLMEPIKSMSAFSNTDNFYIANIITGQNEPSILK